jgi:GTP:adenosylcobinamide-phosphate guanylyltransferase
VTATTALVLAGSRGPGDPLAVHAGVSHKAMIEVGGEPMLVRVVRALAQGGLTRIVIVIERTDLIAQLAAEGRFPPGVVVEALPAAEGPSLSVAQAMERLGTPLLVTTADHALLRPEWVRWFVDHVPAGADVAAGLARSDLVMAAAPEAKRTFLRFSDGAYSGCNLFYFATPAASRVVALWREVETHRKQPLKLLRRLGLPIAARYALGVLPLAAALGRLGALTGTRCAVVEMPFGEAAIDVDKPEDLTLVRKLVGDPS